MKKTFFFLLCVIFFVQCKEDKQREVHLFQEEQPKEVLLLGTFHFNNPGADVAKVKNFDILSASSQKSLDSLAKRIAQYNPAKIFVEWPYEEQLELDSLYLLYREGQYFEQDSLSNFYQKNEIFQLAFRAARLLDHPKVYAVDYTETSFPFDSLMQVIAERKQDTLRDKFEKGIESFVSEFDNQIASGASLETLLSYLNTEKMKRLSIDFHTRLPLLAGSKENFIGPYLSAEWYRRNLYIWSMIQKETTLKDRRVVVLFGASHTALIEEFTKENKEWKMVDPSFLFN